MIIRLASAENAKCLARIRQKAWNSAYRGVYPDEMIDNFDYAAHTARFLRQMEAEDVWVYEIVAEDAIVGFFLIGEVKPGVYRDCSTCLHSLYLLPEYQGKGYGRKAMEFVKAWCREREVLRFYNSCNPHNLRAVAFYEAMGGVIGLRDENNPHPAEDQIYFEYDLG